MLFQSLGKIKRTTIITAIILMALGVVMLLCPELYITSLITLFGYAMLIVSVVMILDFFSGNKALIHCILFTTALVLGIGGICVIVFRDDVLRVLGLLFGILLLIDGCHSLFYSYFYARRSGRAGWKLLVTLSVLSVIFGILLIFNPFWNTTDVLMKAIGFMVLYSGIVSGLRMIWIWPLKENS